MRPVPLALLSIMWVSACDSGPVSGPAEVRWDRETCVRCAMSVGDNRFAAQIREDVEPYQSFLFDDIGCAVIWLQQQTDTDTSSFEIWVNDHQANHWIDARKAWYVTGTQSPMGYNLAAGPRPAAAAVDFNAAVRHIMEVESTRQLHGREHAGHVKVVE